MKEKFIFAVQVATLSGIWVFSVGITVWIIHLVHLASTLHDMPGGSLGISFVAIPVFLTVAGVLTYAFFGMRRARD